MRRMFRLALGLIAAVVLSASIAVPSTARAETVPIQVIIRVLLPTSELNKVPVESRGSFMIASATLEVPSAKGGVIDSEQRYLDSVRETTPSTLSALVRFRGVPYEYRKNLVYTILQDGLRFQFFNVDSKGKVTLLTYTASNTQDLQVIVSGARLKGRTRQYFVTFTITSLDAANRTFTVK